MKSIKYVVITPVKNESGYIERTIESVLLQTIKPELWIIVDDGSTDNTRKIVKEYECRHSFIKLLCRNAGSNRDIGYGGIRAFNFGIQNINPSEYDFIVNLDGDVSFDTTYFEKLFEEFAKDSRLGIAGGAGWSYHKGQLMRERIPEDHVPGCTKIYRRDCYEAIQPIREIPSWDAIDELHAQKLGWKTANFRDIKIIYLKPMTLGAGNRVRGRYVLGKNSYKTGYAPDFVLLRAIKLIIEPPYLIGGALLIAGYIASALVHDRVLIEPELVKYLRRKQRARVVRLLGKN
jgi:glycosyltransferase involved in cell wall biosynthesis